MTRTRKAVSAAAIVLFLTCSAAFPQGGATLSGTITASGAAVANAKVSAKNTSTGQTAEAQTDSSGLYSLSNLAPGEYTISVTAEGYSAQSADATLTAGAQQKVDLALAAAGAPTLKDLGFTPEQAQGSAQDQARLDKRSHMLKVHQRLGLITAAPLLATVLTANGAAGRHGTASGRDLHATLGSITAGMYFTTAYFSVFAPKVPGTATRGPIRLHKFLAWIHGPGMILTPALGALAFEQRSKGERIHGIASAHGAVAATTAIAYGLAIASVSIKF
ncbi:MAG TPA: carboxypeptidase-like regulatory domain-containing protein [Bryobacteraceae bacterium]|nr:carboxypeptidase-like regulatory domain-containing protein [Bryobacteraceae bacterium]